MITDKMVFAAEMGKKYEAALSRGEIVQSDIASRDELMMQYMFASEEEREVDISNKEVSFTAYSSDTPLRAYGLE